MRVEDLYVRRAELVRCVRADLFDLALDLGFDVITTVRCRLAAADAPDRGRPGAKTSTRWGEGWLGAHALVVRCYGRDPDGHWLVDVFDAATGERFATALIAAGHARPW